MENICTFFIKKIITLSNLSKDSDDIEVYVYGLLTFVYTIIPIGILITIGLILDKSLEMLVWLITFISVRKYAGGYHAKNPLSCFLYSVLLGLSSLIICSHITLIDANLYLMCIIVHLIILVTLAPITKKEFSQETILLCKVKIGLLISIFAVILFFFPSMQSIYLHALFCTSFLLVAQFWQK